MKKYIGVKTVTAVLMDAVTAHNHGYKTNGAKSVRDKGYEVTYPDNYKSWSPKEAFEAANRPCTGMPFGHAIEAAKQGNKIARAGWNGKGIYVALQRPDECSKMSQEYLYIDTTGLHTDNAAAPKSVVPWLASQTDMLSDDWGIVD